MITAFFHRHPEGSEVLAFNRGFLVQVGTAPGQLPLPAHVTAFTGESLSAIRAAQHITLLAPPVPQTITATQLRVQLRVDGKVSDPLECAEVKVVISHVPAPQNLDVAAQFEYEPEFKRTNALLIQLAHALGYDTPAKLDAFFIAAAKL